MVPTLPFDSASLDVIYFADVMMNTWVGVMILSLSTILAGLLAGKVESDAAKAGTGPKDRENITVYDWLEDAGYGLLGALIGLATMQMVPQIPVLILPAFGYAGRKLIMKWATKAENTADDQPVTK